MIPGLTDDEENIRKLGELLKDYSCVEYVDLLPFHKLGEYKWQDLKIPYTLGDTKEPDPDLEKYVSVLAEYGLKARYNH